MEMSRNYKLLVEKLAELEKDYALFAREKKSLERQKRQVEEERRQMKVSCHTTYLQLLSSMRFARLYLSTNYYLLGII